MALTKPEVLRLIHYQSTPDSSEAYYKSIWVFSYLANGANMADICRLQFKNIDKDTISFTRSKTKRKKKGQEIYIHRLPMMEEIITNYGNKPETPETYIFNFLESGLSVEEERRRIRQATKAVNKYINRVAEKVKIDQKVTTYTARHTYSQVLKESGESIEYISEALGHENIQTTMTYLKSFSKDRRKKAASNLL
jgi:integrase